MGLGGTASLDEEGWEVEVSAWISGRPPGPADTPPSVVVSSFMGRARPRSTSAWMKGGDDVVLLTSPGRDAAVVVEVLCEEILLPCFVFALVIVGVVVLTPAEYLGMPTRTFVSESVYKGGV